MDGENEVSLQCFGDVLRRMGKNNLAEKTYNRLLVKLSPNDPSFYVLCYSFGMISKDRNESRMVSKITKNSRKWLCPHMCT
jgi:hypothetical protein